jgi:hypothetical protein
MPSSKLRQTLLAMRQLAPEAICRQESLKTLEGLWLEVQDFLAHDSPEQEDRRLLAVLLRNHNAIASTMARVESLQETLLRDTRRDLDEADNCK